MSETRIMREIQLAASGPRTRLLRNNTGALRDKNGGLVRFGLAPGSSDLIGWTVVTITPEHVGRDVAVFTAIEVKDEHGRVTPEQVSFLATVTRMGGIAGIARSVADYLRLTKQ